jgi:hypothetical protein
MREHPGNAEKKTLQWDYLVMKEHQSEALDDLGIPPVVLHMHVTTTLKQPYESYVLFYG